MEDSNPVNGTPEYVIQLQEDVLQGQDLEHAVNLAVISSTPNQVTYIVAAEEVAAVDDDCSKATEHRDDHSQVQESVNQQQDTDQRNSNRNLVVVENVPENENMADLQSNDSDDSVIKQPPQESDVAKQIVRELTELGSETSVTSSNVTDVKDKKEIKAAKRKEISLLNKKLATIPKRPSVSGDGDQVGLEVQPFTVETLKSVSKVTVLKFGTLEINAVIIKKYVVLFYHIIMCSKVGGGMANSVDPDQIIHHVRVV